MKSWTVLLASMLLFTATSFAAVGFSSGNEFIATSITGEITLTCGPEGGSSRTVSFECRDTVLYPTEYDFFNGPAGIVADSVELVVVHDDGSTKAKAVNYDSGRSASKAKFNLWVSSLLQTPLLSYGINTTTYKLRLRGIAVNEGNFIANVKTGGLSQCPASQYYSNADPDCDQPYTYCQRYFQDKNFCQ
jgi:hypothetical protein